ncbi:MAG: hypothetical protein ABSH03_04080 [Candidatus Lustribacter sp.]|jgi:hypothetical protein
MQHPSALTLSAVLALTLGAAPAGTQAPAPVVATACHGTVSSIELVEHASYDATFHNGAGVAADDIHVAIPYGRTKTATFDVRDTFAPGADVNEHLHKNLSGGLFAVATNDDRCTVRYVHFVDGTSWGDPAM